MLEQAAFKVGVICSCSADQVHYSDHCWVSRTPTDDQIDPHSIKMVFKMVTQSSADLESVQQLYMRTSLTLTMLRSILQCANEL